MNPDQRTILEARLAELDRQLNENHDGMAPFGPFYRMAKEHGELRRELERMARLKDAPQRFVLSGSRSVAGDRHRRG